MYSSWFYVFIDIVFISCCVLGPNMHYAAPEFTDPSLLSSPLLPGIGGAVFFNVPYLDDATVKDYVKKQM